jgi:3-oxoadipate enol-lactonase
VAYDHRGHGSSPVPPGPYTLDDLGGDAVAQLDRLEVDPAHLDGLSLGGMVVMWHGIHAPERVGRLVLMCTTAKLGPPDMWEDRARTVRAEGTEVVAAATVQRWLTTSYRARHPDVAARLEALVAAQPDEGYASCCHAIQDMDLVPCLPHILAPTLIIGGAEDSATPPDHQEFVAAHVPDARLEVLSPAAHLATVEQPEVIARLVAGFLLD